MAQANTLKNHLIFEIYIVWEISLLDAQVARLLVCKLFYSFIGINFDDFLSQPPHVWCETKIWHPNISENGEVCLR